MCVGFTSPPGGGSASGAGEGAGIELEVRALTRRSWTHVDLSRWERSNHDCGGRVGGR
jgi:hypothetical protein